MISGKTGDLFVMGKFFLGKVIFDLKTKLCI